jgi:hypothetical protein
MVAVGASAQATSAEAAGLIRDLTHQTAEMASPAFFGCGEIVQDRLVARSLAQIGRSAVRPLEEALDSIKEGGDRSRFPRGAGWLLLVYAKIGGQAAESRLETMALDPKLDFLGLDIDNAIALAQSNTSHVSGSRVLTTVVDCTRSLEPRHALDQMILAWERGNRSWFEASLGPRGKDALRKLLRGRTWGTLRATLWKGPVPRAVAVGYRFTDAGRWAEPWETLETDSEYGPVALDPRAPRIATVFRTSDGKDCGTLGIEFAEVASAKFAPPLPYLVNNSDLEALLRQITVCALGRAATR